MEPNAAVEIHDSYLEQITSIGEDLIAVLDAYVHRSYGRPGVEAGTGWSQRLELRFTRGKFHGSLDEMPIGLAHGLLIVSGQTFDNLLPMPLDDVGPSKLELVTADSLAFTIEGDGVTAEFVGSPRYIEEFQP